MLDENLINNLYVSRDPTVTSNYVDTSVASISPIEYQYNVSYHNSIIDSDKVSDSIKIKVLCNEFMTLKTYFIDSERKLRNEINYLNADHKRLVEENKRLSDEIAAIKQSLYFG